MSVEAPPAAAEAEAEVETAAEVAVEATAESVADQPVTITETCDDADWPAGETTGEAAEVLPPSLLTGEQLVLLYGRDFWKNPEYLARYDAETLQLVTAMGAVVDSKEKEHLDLKAAAAEAKKVYDGKVIELRQLIKNRESGKSKQPPVRQLTIDSALPPDARPAANADPGADVNFPADVEKAQGQFLDELAKKYPIERWEAFGLTKADVAKLHAGETKEGGPCPIVTIGDLQNFYTPYKENPSFSRNFTDLKGVGKAAAQRMEDSSIAFWGRWSNGLGAEFAKELGLEIPQAATPRVEEGGSSDGGSDPAGEGSGDVG